MTRSDEGEASATDLRAVIDRWAALVKATSDDPPDSILRPPASEAAIAALEERLGTTLPPSYRAFLAISDGAAAFPAWGVVAADPDADPSLATGLRDTATVDWIRNGDRLTVSLWSEISRAGRRSRRPPAVPCPGSGARVPARRVHRAPRRWVGEGRPPPSRPRDLHQRRRLCHVPQPAGRRRRRRVGGMGFRGQDTRWHSLRVISRPPRDRQLAARGASPGDRRLR